jgi:succinate-acetate transporter protein
VQATSDGQVLLGCSAIGWIPVSEQKDVGMMLFSFVFPLELVATIFAFLARDTLGATTLGLFTTSWLAFGLDDYSSAPGSTTMTHGIYLFGFATAALLLALMSVQGKPFFSVLLTVAVARRCCRASNEIGGSHEWDKVSGGFGIALAALAMYGGTALGLEDARHQELLPLFRRGHADRAFQGYEAQLDRLGTEPGVRQQL